MSSGRFKIKNRHGLNLVILVDTPKKPNNLVFIAHGQGGFKEQKHIQAFAEAFLENNFRVVRFDATNSIGESGGRMQDVTTTNYIEDLKDVINWAKKQDWFQSPFALAGHSMGGMSTTIYAEEHPDEVLCIAPISTVLSHDHNAATREKGFLEEWKKVGYYDAPSGSKPGVIKRIGWDYMEDLKKYNILTNAGKLSMPVLLLAGDLDNGTPYSQQKLLYDAIPHKNKKLLEIKEADHNFRGPGDYEEKLAEIKKIMSSWLRSLVL